jgi:hypothetical protein
MSGDDLGDVGGGTAAADDPARRADHRQLHYGTVLAPPGITFAMAILVAGGLVGLPISVARGGPWWVLFLLYLAAAVWGSYFLLWLCCYDVVVEGGLLRWRAVLRDGEERMEDATAVDRRGGLHTISFRDGARIHLLASRSRGYFTFLDELHRDNPQLPLPVDTHPRRDGGARRRVPVVIVTMTEEEEATRRRLADSAVAALDGESDGVKGDGARLAERFVAGDLDLSGLLAGISGLRTPQPPGPTADL